MCERESVDPLTASRGACRRLSAGVDRTAQPPRRDVVSVVSGSGLANATIQQRLVPGAAVYDHLIRGGHTRVHSRLPGPFHARPTGRAQRGLVLGLTKLPWIPSERQWADILRQLLTARRGATSEASASITRLPTGSSAATEAGGRVAELIEDLAFVAKHSGFDVSVNVPVGVGCRPVLKRRSITSRELGSPQTDRARALRSANSNQRPRTGCGCRRRPG